MFWSQFFLLWGFQPLTVHGALWEHDQKGTKVFFGSSKNDRSFWWKFSKFFEIMGEFDNHGFHQTRLIPIWMMKQLSSSALAAKWGFFECIVSKTTRTFYYIVRINWFFFAGGLVVSKFFKLFLYFLSHFSFYKHGFFARVRIFNIASIALTHGDPKTFLVGFVDILY